MTDAPKKEDLKDQHPALYGTLLSMNAKLDVVGSRSIIFALVLVLALCFLVYTVHEQEILGIRVGWVAIVISWLLILLKVLGIWSWLTDRRKAAIFRKLRPELDNAMHRAAVDPMAMLARLSGDKSVEVVLAELQRADSPSRRTERDYR